MIRLATRLLGARLYLVCDAVSPELLEGALRGGVGLVQLRCKGASDEQILTASRAVSAACRRHGVPFVLNDRPDLVQVAGADGAHVGQADMDVVQARRMIGADRLLGLSTHTPAQIDAVSGLALDYIGVGPVHSTPTKPGRPAVGLELVRYAAEHASVPFFAIGGINSENLGEVVEAGARRVAVVRALTEAQDPKVAAMALCDALPVAGEGAEAQVGTT